MHGGILARRDRPDDLAAIARTASRPVDVVVVNLYPFAKAAQNPETPFDALVEEIDIGGPSLVRAAAKNFRDVLVVVDPADYPQRARAAGAARRTGARVPLRADAEGVRAHRGCTTRMIDGDAARHRLLRGRRDDPAGAADARRSRWRRTCATARTRTRRRRGRRRRPIPAALADPSGQGAVVHEPARSRCGAAHRRSSSPEPAASSSSTRIRAAWPLGATIAEAYVRAREADPLSAFGGIVGLNRTLDVETARALTSTFIEAVIAPAVDDATRGRSWRRRPNMRVVTTDFARCRRSAATARVGRDARTFLGGALMQERDRGRGGRVRPGLDGRASARS